jgi:predicted phage tail protein
MVWPQIVVWIITTAISYLLAPKPKTQDAVAANLGDFQVPVAEEGKEIPVLFGTRVLTGPNVVWYGDLRVVAVKKKGGKK